MEVKIIPVQKRRKPVLANLIELYEYELSNYRKSDLDENARFGYKYLDSYWIDPDRHAFFVKVDGNLAGFVLVNKHNLISTDAWSIAEFFVMRKYRKKGVGKSALFYIFDKFPGKWEIAEMKQNKEAQEFWRNVIKEYTNGQYQETLLNNESWNGPIQTFEILTDKKN